MKSHPTDQATAEPSKTVEVALNVEAQSATRIGNGFVPRVDGAPQSQPSQRAPTLGALLAQYAPGRVLSCRCNEPTMAGAAARLGLHVAMDDPFQTASPGT